MLKIGVGLIITPRLKRKGRPRHHSVDDLVLAARWLHERGQLLLSHPELALVEFGPTMWMNHVLLFVETRLCLGGYGRVSDFHMHVERLSLTAAIFHYLDDCHGIEPEGDSSFCIRRL